VKISEKESPPMTNNTKLLLPVLIIDPIVACKLKPIASSKEHFSSPGNVSIF
jgi:hypothetical protein